MSDLITPQQVETFWAHMQNEFGSSVEQKNDSLTMEVAAALLDALKIQDKELFMKHFVTTLGRTIYIPFEIGVPDLQWTLWSQIRVCVHEHQHVVQGERDSWVVFDSRYLVSTSYRAGYEAEAYGCDLEMEFWRTGQIFDINARAEGLKNYGCDEVDIDMVKQILTIRAGVVSQGVVENRSSIVAIKWLEANAGSLREHI